MNIENLCQICQEKSAPYKCPKCHIKYCSLICYRDRLHKKCSKEFDENELLDSMNIDETNCENQTTTNEFVRERINEILKRKNDEKDFHDEHDNEQIDELFEHILPSKEQENIEADEDAEECILSDEESPPDLPNDIDESDENVNKLWDCLTADEKLEFKTMLNDGRISHLLNDYKPWKPWWLYKTAAPPLISDLDTVTSTSTLPDTIPAVLPNIVPLPSLTSVLPHVHVRFDVFEILFAYALISIRYRGDFVSYTIESGHEFLHLASRHLIEKSHLFDEEYNEISILNSRISLIREYLQDNKLSYRVSEEFFVNLLGDILCILHGPYQSQTSTNIYVLAALSDVKRYLTSIQQYKTQPETTINVFHANRTVHRKEIKRPSNKSKLCIRKQTAVCDFDRKIIRNLTHKIDYFLSWTITHSDRLVLLEHELREIENELRAQLDRYQRDKKRIEQNLKHIRLQTKPNSNRIQEL